MPISKELLVALDQKQEFDSLTLQTALMRRFPGEPIGFKVNPNNFLKWGEEAIYTLAYKTNVMADLALNYRDDEMRSIIERLGKMGVAYVSVDPTHIDIIAPILEELHRDNKKPNIIIRTIPSYFTDDMSISAFGLTRDEALDTYSQKAFDVGAFGIMLPPDQLPRVENLKLAKFVSGIRPEISFSPKEHSSVLTASRALEQGATHLIVGKPIYEGYTSLSSKNAFDTVQKVLEEIKKFS